MNISPEAERIKKHLLTYTKPVVVWQGSNGQVLMREAKTAKGADAPALRKHADQVIGVYTPNVPVAWIQEDLAHFGLA